MSFTKLPAEVIQALQRGNAIEAIKLLRQRTGLGLKEAKDVLDAHQRGLPLPERGIEHPDPALSPAVAEAIRRRNTIEAIRLFREETGMGLKESREIIERAARSMPRRGSGEVTPSSPGRVLLLLMVLAALAYYLHTIDQL